MIVAMNKATNPGPRSSADGTALSKTSGRPLHFQLKDAIIRDIGNGRYGADSAILSERELCVEYAVSRTTVRKAIADLMHEGWLYVVSGKGSFVANRTLTQDIEPLVGFTQAIERQGLVAATKILRFHRCDADDELAALMGVRPGSALIELVRLRIVTEKPVAVQTVFLPEHLCPGILGFDFNVRSLYDVFRSDYGLELVSGHTKIDAALADDVEKSWLALPEPAAILRSEQITKLADNRIIELCRSSFVAGVFSLQLRGGQAGIVELNTSDQA
jgi:GntR family transcriptional regulator